MQAASDFDRELSEYGVAQVNRTISELLAVNRLPDLIYASPLVRAQQTAKLVSQKINLPVNSLDTITPEGDPKQVVNWLLDLDGENVESVMLVTHNPFVSNLLGLMVGDQAVGMSTGALACIQTDIPGIGLGEFELYFEPR